MPLFYSPSRIFDPKMAADTVADSSKQGAAWTRVSRLGAGSFATVWLGRAASDGKFFAVKTAEDDSRSAESLRREFEVLGSLKCDQIVRCFGAESTVENGIAFYNVLMEYMERGSVAEILKRGPLSEEVIRSHIRSVLMGLRFLHERGIVHGDVKGGNVLVGLDGSAKLGDFGCASKVGFAGERSWFCGTPLWTAPEVVLMLEQGTPSDIWSLGCTVVEMATRKNPWSGFIDENGGIGAALHRIGRSDDLPCVPEGVLSQAGLDFLSKCLIRDPSKRWTSEQLLRHPFVNDMKFCGCPEGSVAVIPLSPVSPFEFGTKEWDYNGEDSGSVVSCSEMCRKDSDLKGMANTRPSPDQRIQRLVAGDLWTASGSDRVTQNCKLFEGLSQCFGQWVSVRGSPETTPAEAIVSGCVTGLESSNDVFDASTTPSESSSVNCCSSGGRSDEESNEDTGSSISLGGFPSGQSSCSSYGSCFSLRSCRNSVFPSLFSVSRAAIPIASKSVTLQFGAVKCHPCDARNQRAICSNSCLFLSTVDFEMYRNMGGSLKSSVRNNS